MALILTLRDVLATFVDVFNIIPERLRELNLEEIKRLPIHVGTCPAELGGLFEVTGSPHTQHMVWKGDLSRANGIGHAMTSGTIQVLGNAGNHLGSRMGGGEIKVAGSAGNWLGAQQLGGTILVHGDAGDQVGGSYDAGGHGQNGGVILIQGSAGADVGASMRRGLIAIAGSVGDRCAYQMRAGTIVLGGNASSRLGAGMIRGTVILTGDPIEPPPGFRVAGVFQPPVARLVEAYLMPHGFRCGLTGQMLEMFQGDMLTGGRGEIFVPSA